MSFLIMLRSRWSVVLRGALLVGAPFVRAAMAASSCASVVDSKECSKDAKQAESGGSGVAVV